MDGTIRSGVRTWAAILGATIFRFWAEIEVGNKTKLYAY